MSLYSDVDLPHVPGPELDWQESVVLIFHDERTGVAGFLRCGSEPNIGFSQVHWGIMTQDGLRFRGNEWDVPLKEEDRRPDGFASGPLRWDVHQDHIHVYGEKPGCSVDLKMRDFFPSVAWGEGTEDIAAPHHYESSGRVDGTIIIGDQRFDLVDALGHRDHSWGPRDVTVMRSFRWLAGSCGEALSFNGLNFHGSNGAFSQVGWIARHGKIEQAKEVDIWAHVNRDGLSIRGGGATITVQSGERFDFEIETIDGLVNSYRTDCGGPGSSIAVEGMSRVRCNGLTGFADLNIANNIAGGEKPAPSVDERWAMVKNGISQRLPR